MSHLYVNPSVGLCQVENGYVAFDAAAQLFHELNPAAALIVELADGTRSADEILAIAIPLIPGDDAAGKVREFVDEGLASGLLMAGDGSRRPARFLTTEEIREAGDLLWERDQGEAALQLARRATELEPENAASWFELGGRARRLEQFPIAIEAYRHYLELNPEDETIRQILAGLEGGPPPERCSDRCIELIFEGFAANYDEKMREALRYEAPERLEEMLAAHLDGLADLEALDLGCGTGLMGVLMGKRTRRLIGVDLSAAMVERAQALGVYDEIELGEIHVWLEACGGSFDLIASSDCLVYVGDLGQITRLAALRLRPGGWLAYTVEKGEVYPLELKPTGRYTHHRAHIAETALAAGLDVVEVREGFLRNEAGNEVTGWVVLLRKPRAGR